MKPMEPVCYGFIHLTEQLPGAVWISELARPFRANWLWLWGDHTATLLSLKVAHDEHLTQQMPFMMMRRSISPEKFLEHGVLPRQAAPAVESNGATMLLNGARLHSLMARDFEQPSVSVRAAALGEQMSAISKGNVRGVVLVGWEEL